MTHYFTLRALSAELDAALRGSVITGIFTQTKDELLITFSTGDALCTSVHPSFNYCFLQQGLTRAKRNTVDLFPAANGAAVVGVDMVPYDRTLAAELAGERRLLFRLYGT